MKKNINPKDFYVSGRAYSHGVKVDVGDSNMLFITGQIAKDEKGEIVGLGDVARQTEYVFEKVKGILSEANMDLADIVKVNIYVTDMGKFEKISKVRDRYLIDSKPASTTVGISGTATKGCEIEIDAIAVKKK